MHMNEKNNFPNLSHPLVSVFYLFHLLCRLNASRREKHAGIYELGTTKQNASAVGEAPQRAECLRQRISHMQMCLTNPIGVSKGCSEGKVSNTNGITSSMPQPAEITGQFQNSLLDQVRPCSRVVVRSLRRVPC
jgi:hypothetical protein